MQVGKDPTVYEVETASGSERVVAVLEEAEKGHPHTRKPLFDRLMELMDETRQCHNLLHEPLASLHPASW